MNLEEPAIIPPTTDSPASKTQLPPVDTLDPAIQKVVGKAKEDLSKQLNLDVKQITLLEAKAIDWPDAALGCPQPEMVYATVVTPGYWILLEADGKQYPYHTDRGKQFILCKTKSLNATSGTPSLPEIPVNPTEIQDGQPWVPVN
jgi:hypothetical protein